jgi:excisionase family DNA binding protein
MSVDARPVRDHLLTAEEAAEYLGVSAYTVREWARQRKVPAVQLGRYWRFRESSLADWLGTKERAAR